MRYLLDAAVGLVNALLAAERVKVDEIVAAAKRIVARHALGPSTQAIVDAAEAREIPGSASVCRQPDQAWLGKQHSMDKDSGHRSHRADCSRERKDKALTKQLLREAQMRCRAVRLSAAPMKQLQRCVNWLCPS